MILHALEHALLDTVRMVPFLLAAFLILEAVEHYSNQYMNRVLGKVGKAGPVVGALFGCVPQCGFSVAAANLYSGGVITLGTLLAVFLSTCVPNVYITLAGPSFFFIFCVWLGQYWPKEYEWCSPKYWGEHFYDAGDPYRSMLLKAGVTLAVIIVLGAASVANGKRRQQNA